MFACLLLFIQNRKNWFKRPKRAGSPEDILLLCFSVFIPACAGVWAPSEQQMRPFASGEPSGVGGPRHGPSPGRKTQNFYCRGKSLYSTFLFLLSIVKLISTNGFCMWKRPILTLPGLTLPPVSPELSLKRLIHCLTWSKISNMLLSVCLLLTWTGKNMLTNVNRSL